VGSGHTNFKEPLLAVSGVSGFQLMVHPDTVDVPSKRTLTEVSYDYFTYRAVVGVRFGGYRLGPGIGYYGGGGLSLIVVIVLILLLMRVI
jgi:hypothetical protein